MPYTVSQFCRILDVSIRTLHWYDKLGLLKPAYYGNNGYRYYEKKELNIMKNIIFLKNIGFNLNDIKELLESFEQKALNIENKKSQISFFKNIGFNVADIKQLMFNSEKSKVAILQKHKSKLINELKSKSEIIIKIDHIINELTAACK